jgi:hypothetical protein
VLGRYALGVRHGTPATLIEQIAVEQIVVIP